MNRITDVQARESYVVDLLDRAGAPTAVNIMGGDKVIRERSSPNDERRLTKARGPAIILLPYKKKSLTTCVPGTGHALIVPAV